MLTYSLLFSKSEYHSSSKDKEKSRSSSSSSKEKHSSNKHKDKHSSDKHNSKHSSGEKKLEPPSKTEKQTEKERKNTDSGLYLFAIHVFYIDGN